MRRLARELGVDIGLVAGNGADGRISIEDVQIYVKNALAIVQAGGGGAVARRRRFPISPSGARSSASR